jgi:hypothetical protein
MSNKKTGCDDIQTHVKNETEVSVSCWDMKEERRRKLYVDRCHLNEKTGLTVFD